MKNPKLVILEHFLFGFLIIGLLLGLKIVVENTTFGHRVDLFVFEILQGQLSPFHPQEDLPIVVVDISKMEEDQGAKDRDRLLELVTAIARAKPKAIGVDIAFSPEKGAWRTGFDEMFLSKCLEMSAQEGVPIFLGVEGKFGLGNSSAWLGHEAFLPMAATIGVDTNEIKRMPLWVRQEPDGTRLPSMGFALASTATKRGAPGYLAWAIDTVESFPGRVSVKPDIDNNAAIEYADTLVNFSKLEAIYQTRLLTISAASASEFEESFNDRIVILGNGKRLGAFDAFTIPGRGGKTFPGVYLHAVTAYTLLKEPIYEFKLTVRIVLDVCLGALILLIVAYARWRHLADGDHFDWPGFQRKLVWRCSFIILILAGLMVYFVHILWLDFLYIIIALLSHSWFEDKIRLLCRKIWAISTSTSLISR